MVNIQELRATLKQKRLTLDPFFQQQAGLCITEKICTLPIFQDSQKIGLYFAHKGETPTTNLLEVLHALGKKCFMPVISTSAPNTFEFFPYTPGDVLTKNRYGIEEPSHHQASPLPATELDIIFVPLVAFDLQGNRVGMGVGYYDRTLAFMKNASLQKPLLLGLAYEFQKVDSLERQEWDIPLHGVITEKAYYRF